MLSDDTNFEFPCNYPIKIIGKDTPKFESIIIPIINKHVPNISEAAISIKHSSGNKYISMTVSFIAESKQQLDKLYQELSHNEQTIMIL